MMHYPPPCQHGPGDVREGVRFPYRLVARVQPAGAAEARGGFTRAVHY
jgi:hypothetical protein